MLFIPPELLPLSGNINTENMAALALVFDQKGSLPSLILE